VADRAAFRRILCAVDSDAVSNETIRQAVSLAGPQAEALAGGANPAQPAHEAPCSVLVARPS